MIGYSNSGQACHAGTRLIVPEAKLMEVEKLLVQSVPKMKVGSPWEDDAIIGPIISKKQYETVQGYIQSGIDEGAKLLVGGLGLPEGFDKGYFVKPTVFTHTTRDMKIVSEEIFGPVISVLTYKTLDEAIEIANDTVYGLSAYVFSADQEKAINVANRIHSGRVLVNIPFSTELKAPFGGMRQSGIGRVGGHYSIDGYVETKAILLS
jgi:aldehyde dehydrogenase (NAD+)